MNEYKITTPTDQDINCVGDVYIDSILSGTLFCEGTLTITARGSVQGEAHVQSANIQGTFVGFLEVRDRVIFSSGAKFQGVLDAQSMLCPPDTEMIGEFRIVPNQNKR